MNNQNEINASFFPLLGRRSAGARGGESEEKMNWLSVGSFFGIEPGQKERSFLGAGSSRGDPPAIGSRQAATNAPRPSRGP